MNRTKINILNNSDDPSKTGYELHKKLIEEGINPDELAKIIRYDEIEKLQEKSTQNEFNFNQNIEPSAYERYSFINEKNVTLIDFAAFFGSVKCFKFLLLNGANVQNTGKYAVAGGNLEIMHLCEQNHSTFEKGYEIAIKFHQKDIFKYLYESKIIGIKNLEELGKKCITSFNYKIFLFLQENGMNINDDIVNESARIGNLYLVKHFIQNNQIPNNILVYSLESGNMQVIKLLLDQGVDVNARNIYLCYLKFISITFNFQIIFGNYFIYLKHHLSLHLKMVL